MLLVEQNIHRALEFVQRAYIIENGRIVLEGDRTSLLGDKTSAASSSAWTNRDGVGQGSVHGRHEGWASARASAARKTSGCCTVTGCSSPMSSCPARCTPPSCAARTRMRASRPCASQKGAEDRVFVAADLTGCEADPLRARTSRLSGTPNFPSSPSTRSATRAKQVAHGRRRNGGGGRGSRCNEIEVDYEPLPPVVDMKRALEPGAARVHDHWPDNLFCETALRLRGVRRGDQGGQACRDPRISDEPADADAARRPRLPCPSRSPQRRGSRLCLASASGTVADRTCDVSRASAQRRMRVICPDVGGCVRP